MTSDDSEAGLEPAADVDAREAERIRRRDRDAAAAERDLMKPGMGKVFKQIQDAQRKAADQLVGNGTTSPGSRRRRRDHDRG